MQKAVLGNTINFKEYLDAGKIPNKVYYKLINPNGQITAGLCGLEKIHNASRRSSNATMY